jgi:hypothetical protein
MADGDERILGEKCPSFDVNLCRRKLVADL